MTKLKFILKSLTHYYRTHISVLIGTLVTTAILTGALIVGDSVQYSLKRIALLRLGNTEYALNTNDRFFRQQLAKDMSEDLDIMLAPILQLDGIAINNANQARVNKVQVLGVEKNFWEIGKTENQLPDDNEIAINTRLADRLKIRSGDELLVRIEKINFLPADVPFASKDNHSIALRLKVSNILDDNQFGRFNLTTSQISPYNMFIPIDYLSDQMELSGLCNVMLVENSDKSEDELNAAIASHWQPADAQFEIRELDKDFELISSRIFIDNQIMASALNHYPKSQQILTYFVNTLQYKDRATPYSFISGFPLITKDIKDNEIIINQWLADDLKAKVGDEIQIKYFVPDVEQKLVEDSTKFTVHSIIQIANEAADKTLAPNFPGLSDSENCQDWDPGIPIDLDAIRDKDEVYWDNYHATPKAFITLDKAKELWGNRYGSLTSIRFSKDHSIKEISNNILSTLSPESFGLNFQPVHEEALKSSQESTDFGQLFIGLSFFIIASALLLTAMLFVLGIEQRKGQTAILLSMGFLPKQIRNILLAEGLIVAIIGGILGVFAGILYNRIVVHLLATIWIDTVGTSSLVVQVKLSTAVIGGIISMLLAVFAMIITVRKQTLQTIKSLQTNAEPTIKMKSKRAGLSLILSIISFLIVGIILILVNPGQDKSAANVFWGAGFLMLMGFIFLVNWLLYHIDRSLPKKLSLLTLAIKNITRKKGRNLATIVLLSFGVFVIIGVGANRHDALKNADSKTSGTGGYTFWAEITIPVLQDMNSDKSQRQFGLKDANITANFVSMKVYDGDDASCLNLNKISQPRVLGVNPSELQGRFSFTKNDVDWSILDRQLSENTLPAIADMGTIIWSLGKSLGDTVTYINENGNEIHLKLVAGLAGSMLQGNILISRDNFIDQFPTVSGTKAFLIDTNNDKDQVMNLLSRTMQDYGIEIVTTVEKLAGFQNLENTYLSIFLSLGGLGVILGTIGIGILVVRNILERRGELALLQAVGFKTNMIKKLILIENLTIVFAGILVGVISAIFAVLPSLLSPGQVIPYGFILMMVFLITISGIFWTFLAARLSMKGDLIPALRSE